MELVSTLTIVLAAATWLTVRAVRKIRRSLDPASGCGAAREPQQRLVPTSALTRRRRRRKANGH